MLYRLAWSGSALVWIAQVSRRQRWSRSPEWSQGHHRRHRRNDESRHSTFQWGRSETEDRNLCWFIENTLSPSSFLKVAHTIFKPLHFDTLIALKGEVSIDAAPVGQGFWSLGPQHVWAWTRCQKEAPPPRLSYSESTFLGTPLSRTAACNTERWN